MMEPERPEANAFNLSSDLLKASSDEEQRPLGFDSERRVGEGGDVGPQVPSHEQVNQDLLIQFDVDKTDTHDILQPQSASTGTEGYIKDELHGILQPQSTSIGTEEDPEDEFHGILQPQSTSIDTEEDPEDEFHGILQPQRTSIGTEEYPEDEFHGILQPQSTSIGTKEYPEDELHGILQPQSTSTDTEEYPEDERRKHSDTAAESDEENPQNVSIDDEEGSLQKRLQYESADIGFGTYAAADDDDDHNDDDDHKNRYVLKPQELSIHFGAEADVSFDALGKENRDFPQTQNTKEDEQQEPPELLFEPDDGTDYVAADDENSYIRHAEPSPPEADLDVEEEAPELEFEPDFAADHDSDGDANRYIRQSQPFAPEADLDTAQESPELEFEPDFAAGHDSDGDANRYIRQSQPFAPEADLDTAQDSPELEFELDFVAGHDNDGKEYHSYVPQSQPSMPEADLDTAEESPELQFEPDDVENQFTRHSQPSAPEADFDVKFTGQHMHEYDNDDDDDDDDANDEGKRYVPESQREDNDAEDEPPELQFQQEDDNIDDQYFIQSQNSAQEVDRDAAALHFQQAEAAAYGDEYDDDVSDDDDKNRLTSQLHNVAQAGFEEETPELQSQPGETFYAAASHDDGDDDDDDDGGDGDGDGFDGSRYTLPLDNVAQADVEEETPELQSQPDDNVYAAASHDDDYDDDYDDDGNRYTSQLHNVVQADVEEETPELQSQPGDNVYAAASHDDDYDDDYDDDGNRYTLPLDNVAQADVEEETPELQSQPVDNVYAAASHDDDYDYDYDDDDDDGNRYTPQLHNVVQADVEEETPELQSQPGDNVYAAASHDDDYDDDYDDDGNRYSPQLHNVAQADVEEETPELQSQPGDNVYDAASQDDDYDDDYDDDGNRYSPQLHNVVQADVEEETPELQSQPGDNVYAAASHDDDYDDDYDDDGNRYSPQLHNVAQADVEEETPELQSQPGDNVYDAASHGDDSDEDDDDENRHITSRKDDQGLGSTHEQQLYDAAVASPATFADDDSDAYDEHSRQNVPEYSTGHDHGIPELRYSSYDEATGADDDDHLKPQLVDSSRNVEPESGSDDEQTHEEDFYQQGNIEYANYGADDGSHDNDRYIEENVAQESDDYEEEPYEQEHSNNYEASVGVNEDDDDDIRYASRSDESEPTVEYGQMPYDSQQQQQQRSYFEDEYDDDDDDDHGIIGSSPAETEGIQDDEHNPRLLIKGILSEGEADERYAEKAYQGENEEEDEDDTDVAIDIRDNTNVEDQFIEFEDSSFVEAAVGGVLEDAGLNGEKRGSQEEIVDDELEATGGTAAGADDGGDNKHEGAEGVARASTSRVRFADEDPDYEHHDHNADRHADDDDYHIIAGASNQSSYDNHDHNHAEAGEKTLDVLLLEEICEEAASMTIKEALIHSLKPNVRAGLTTAHLKLSESEVLALEEYCEDFVGGLIKDLLKRSSLMELSSKTNKNVVKASVIKTTAKHLSAMEVQHMKVYCDHFVHNVIAESIIDSSMIVARQQHQAEEIKELLHMFQNSEEMQEYFTNLTTDIVRTALLNVTAKDDMEEDSHGSEQLVESSEYEPTEAVEQSSYPGEGLEFENQEDDFDFDGSHSFGIPVPDDRSAEYRRSRSQESWTSEDEDEMGTNDAGRSQRMKANHNERSPPGHSTLEFDEEWAEGIIGKIEHTPDGEKRQKIYMRELEFDDRANVGGTELLAPVFLAVAEDNEDDTEFVGLRRKTQSIEDLCDLIEEEKEPPRKRASSLTQPKKKPRKKPRPNSFHDQMEELKKEAINEDIPDAEPEEEQLHISPEPPSSPKTSSDKSFYAYDDERYRWHTVRVNNREKVLDLKLIEPYMKVITHGGVHTPTRAVIVVIAACYLPDKTKKNYEFLMEQLFFYMISTLELLATTDEYFLVYFNGGTTQGNQPALPWMKRFYQHIEGGLKKNMINMFIVHPNFWLKTVVRFAKTFVGTNFWSKLQFMKSLDELSTKIPVEFIYVPDEVIRCDPKYKRVHNL